MMTQNIEKIDFKKNEVEEKFKIFQLVTSNIDYKDSSSDIQTDLLIF